MSEDLLQNIERSMRSILRSMGVYVWFSAKMRARLWQCVQETLLRPWVELAIDAFVSGGLRRRPTYEIKHADPLGLLHGRAWPHYDKFVVYSSGNFVLDLNTTLHEIAHLAIDHENKDHGPRWARAYVDGTRRFLENLTGLSHHVELDQYAGERVTGVPPRPAAGHFQSDLVEAALAGHFEPGWACGVCLCDQPISAEEARWRDAWSDPPEFDRWRDAWSTDRSAVK